LSLTGAEFQDSNGSVSIGGGKVTREGTLTAPEAVKKARELRANGHGAAAQGLEEIAKGLKGGEAIAFKEETGLDGKSATFHAKHGTETDWMDLSNRTSGREAIHKDVDKGISDHGVDIGSAMQMALARDPAIASFVSDPNSNKYKRNANIAETAKDLGEDMGKWLSQKGQSIGYSEGSAGGSMHGGVGLKLLGTGGGISGSVDGKIGRRSQENESVNILTSEYDKLIRQSVSEARGKGLNREETEKYVAGKIGDFTQNLYDQAREAKSIDYGADAPVGIAKRVLDNVSEYINPIDLEEAKRNSD